MVVPYIFDELTRDIVHGSGHRSFVTCVLPQKDEMFKSRADWWFDLGEYSSPC